MADCCQRSIERRKLQMKEIVSTENTESTEKRERRGERLQGIPLERITPRPAGLICPEEKFRGCPPMLIGAGLEVCRQKFQALEVLEQEVPRFGNFGERSSKVWKFWKKEFQCLEILKEKVPRFGSFEGKSSNAAPTAVGASLAPIVIGAGLEILKKKVPRPVPREAGFGSSVSTAIGPALGLAAPSPGCRLYRGALAQSVQQGILRQGRKGRLVNGQ